MNCAGYGLIIQKMTYVKQCKTAASCPKKLQDAGKTILA